MKKIFKNANIVTMNKEKKIIESGYFVVRGTKIIEIKEGNYYFDGTENEIIDLKGSIVLPGLINAHSHSYSNIVKGTTENIPLEIWMLYVMKEGNKLSSEDIYISSLLGSIEMLKGGTTAFLDHLAQPLPSLLEAAKAYKQVGIRAWVTPMFTDKYYEETLPGKVDPSSEPTENLSFFTEMLEEFYKKMKGFDERVNMGVGPSGPHRCSDHLLQASYGLAEKYNLPWHTHILESKPQQVKAEQMYKTTMIEHLHEMGILSNICSFAHTVWITEKEMDLLANSKVSVVHNPVSNLYLGSGKMPLLKMKAKGINIALGTDGANCNGSQSMFESMKLASILSNITDEDYSLWLTSMDALQMATNNSATALLAEDYLGSIEVGKEADFIILDRNNPSLTPLNNLIWQVVYGSRHLLSSVYIAGTNIVEDGKVQTLNENEVYMEANERAQSLLKRLEVDYQSISRERGKVESLIRNL